MRLPLNDNPRVTTEYMVAGTGSLGRHLGVDWAAPVGTPVYAPGDGVVVNVSTGAAGGKTLEVLINGLLWRFLHLNEFLVSKGQSFRMGDVLAKTGKTGKVTGPHLHTDVRLNGTTWNASLSNYRDPRTVVADANKPKPDTGKRLYFSPIGQTATFYKVSGGTFKMHIKDASYNWRVLKDEGNRVLVNSASAGGQCWVYLKYTATGKPIPGRYVK